MDRCQWAHAGLWRSECRPDARGGTSLSRCSRTHRWHQHRSIQASHRCLVDEVIYTADLGERKAKMYQLADTFVVLPGGLGTADEWIATLSQLVVDGDESRIIVVANLHGLYDSLLRYLDEMARSPFARDRHLDRSVVANSQEELIEKLNEI